VKYPIHALTALIAAVSVACAWCSTHPRQRHLGVSLGSPLSIVGTLTPPKRVGWPQESIVGSPEHPAVVVVGRIQPVLPPGAGPREENQVLHLHNVRLLESPDGDSVIGGLTPGAPAGTRPARIRILGATIDARIKIGANVKLEDDVIVADAGAP
jgi:hypothetical protein